GSRDFPIGNFDSDQAQMVKNTLLAYPKNRRKNRATRELSLDQALKADAEKIATPTVNKYLQTYISLFGWAKRNRYVAENFFDGMTIYRRKGKLRPTRDGFTTAQVEVIVEEALHRSLGLVRHDWQKWGLLIATFSGA